MKKEMLLIGASLLAISLSACGGNSNSKSSVEESLSDVSESSTVSSIPASSSRNSTLPSSTSVSHDEMKLRNANGIEIQFGLKGARIESLKYGGTKIGENGFVAGRVANRVAGGKFTLDGSEYNLNRNEGQNTLHGGSQGFGEINWNLVSLTENQICFSLHSPDLDMGFPGNLDVTTTYTLSDDGSVLIEYRAVCDKKTIFNPTNHMYMNLNGSSVLNNHELMIDADYYTERNFSLLPTGKLISVANSKLDYRTKKTYVYTDKNDDNLVLNGEGYRKVAELEGKTSGIKMELYTDQPGIQLYNTDSQVCLETQHYPDSIHFENFPSIVLNANEEYYSKTCYKFTKSA